MSKRIEIQRRHVEFESKEYQDYLVRDADSLELQLPIGLLNTEHSVAKKKFPVLGNADQHCCLLGNSGCGVSNTTLAIMGGLCKLYSLNELQLVYADFNATDISNLIVSSRTAAEEYAVTHQNTALLPNMVIVESCTTISRQLALLDKIKSLIDARINWLRDNNMLGFAPNKGLPRMLVILDGALPKIEKDSDTMRTLCTLLMTARSAGVHFMLTGTSTIMTGGVISSIFNSYVTMHLCMRMESRFANALQCPWAASLVNKFGIVVAASAMYTNSYSIYEVPLMNNMSLYNTFNSPAERYYCRIELPSDPLYLYKTAIA